MTNALPLSRRGLLASAAAFGLSLNYLGSVAFAAADAGLARRKLVVIVCRGAMDGLSVFPAVGDSNYARLRGPIAVPGFGAANGALKIDSTFGLHPSLAAVHRLALAGQARIAPAVATPDRSRSHFEAQDALESGVSVAYGSSGWLNRALQAMAPSRKVTALSMGPQLPLILRGKIEATTWSPGALDTQNARLTQVLSDLYAKDPLLGPALATGLEAQAIARQAGITDVERPSRRGDYAANMSNGAAQQASVAHQKDISRVLGKALAGLMAADHGPSIAAMSVLGFDTHVRQRERIAERLAYVDGLVEGLANGLGPRWKDTVVVAITEFGRTAHVNGNEGTDHGTASAALLAGGAIRPGGIVGDWPTLQQPKLFESRDVAPTMDMRSLLKGVMADHLAIDRGALDTLVFPGSAPAKPAANLIG